MGMRSEQRHHDNRNVDPNTLEDSNGKPPWESDFFHLLPWLQDELELKSNSLAKEGKAHSNLGNNLSIIFTSQLRHASVDTN